jgi:alpha-mannosidase
VTTLGVTYCTIVRQFTGMDPTTPHTIVVVSHTHWDREWYHPLPVMRHRLAALIDTLLSEPDGRPFLLDGQAVVLDDYRALRPERLPALQNALRTSAVEAGPWYVLPDMLIPSGEALVRNLLEGGRTVRELGGTPPPVLYSPDAFGHAAAGPALAAGFGFGVAVVWRGYGAEGHPRSTATRWKHPSGAVVLLSVLPPGGYEFGASLPLTEDLAALRWRSMRDVLLTDSPLPVVLLPNGADHHARQIGRPAALEHLAAVAAPHAVVADSLRGFAERLLLGAQRPDVVLPSLTGELRDSSGRTWSLQGTFATRAHQKRRNAGVERLLLREVEPWTAMAWFLHRAPVPTLRSAWRTVLTTHPHDTLCGCSIDAVAAAADLRWDDAESHALAIRDDALRVLTACDPTVQRGLEPIWRSTLILRNPAARARGGVARLRLIDADVSDPVGPGSASRTGARVAQTPGAPDWSGDELMQVVSRTRAFDRVESPQHYPRNAIVRVSEMLAWVDPMPAYSVQPVALADLVTVVRKVAQRDRVRGTPSELNGPAWRITSSMQGVSAAHVPTGARIQPLGWLESTTDAGDTYTPSLRGQPLIGRWSAPTLISRGPLRAEWECTTSIERPRTSVTAATDPVARQQPAREMTTVSATATLAMHAGTDWMELTIRGENPAGDHRLRWVLPLPGSLHTHACIADAAFGPIQRETVVRDPRTEWVQEKRIPTAPLHRWLLLTGPSYGLGIVSDGLAEYELLPDGHLAITLLRAVGELSRRDLPERPGHAGWPQATPAAQSRGEFTARFALVAVPHDMETALATIEATADDVLMPLTGDTWRGVGTALTDFPGLALEGEGLVFSAAKQSDDGEWLVLRCINHRAGPVRGTWHLPRPATEVRLSRLDESLGLALTGTGPRIRFEAPAYGIVTLLVR